MKFKFLVSKEPSVWSVMLSCCVLAYSYLTAWGLILCTLW